MNINVFDAIVLLLFGLFFVLGLKNGVIKETVATVGIIVIYIISYSMKGLIGNFLCKTLPFFQFSGSIRGLTSLNILIYQLIAFILIFSLLMIIFGVIMFATKIAQTVLNATVILAIPSMILGGIIGLIKGYIVIFIMLFVLCFPLKDNSLYQSSKARERIMNHSPILTKITYNFTESITSVSNLVKNIKDNKISTEQANSEIIDTLLKYKMVDEKTVNKLIEMKKI